MAKFIARFWFPTALVLLLLLALPGMVLFAMNLLGFEGDVNRWLQDNYGLTYSIGVPWWGVLILLLLPFLVLLLYFLKLKRKPLQVPSTFLWRKSIEDLHVNSLLQWLRQNVLLLLQLLIVIAFIYSVMSFRFHGRAGEGRHYIVMIDNSASMSAGDVSPSRLEWAKAQALKEIDAASDDDFGMVIVFNSSAQTLQSRTNNRDLLRAAIRGIQPTQRPTRIEEALTLADSLANPSRSTENEASRPPDEEPGKERTYVAVEGTPTAVHLFSDGRFPDVRDFNLGNLRIHFHLAGEPGPENVDNVAITTCNALRDDNDPTKLRIFVGLRNYRPKEVETRVELEYWVNGKRDLQPDRKVQLPARTVKEEKERGKDGADYLDNPGEGTAVFELKDLDDTADIVLHVRLLDVKDRFPLDNEAWLVVGVVRKARVLIVTTGNRVLQSFFDNNDAVRAVAKVDYLSPDDLTKETYLKPALNGSYDLVIFDCCGPAKEEDMPRANTFFIGYPPPPWKPLGSKAKEGKPVEALENPHIKGWMHKHSVLKYLVGLHEIGIDKAFRMKDLPPRTPMLMESDLETPLLLTLNRQAFTDLVLTFPILVDNKEWNTDWMTSGQKAVSLPLFLRNVLYTYGNVSDSVSEDTVQPGMVKTLRPDVTRDEITVIDPKGGRHVLKRGKRPDFTFGETDWSGVYQVVWDDEVQRSFAVNLLDAEESNLEPRESLQIGNDEVAAGKTRGQPLELWRWVVLAALGLLLLEWYIYNRRVYI